jgi:hypothetical protein
VLVVPDEDPRWRDGRSQTLGHHGTPVVVRLAGQHPWFVDGPAAAASFHNLGFTNVVGRPGCQNGAPLVTELVRRWHPPEVAIIAQRSPIATDGAVALAQRLVHVTDRVLILHPPAPHYNATAWHKAGARREDVLDAIRHPAEVHRISRPGEGGGR